MRRTDGQEAPQKTLTWSWGQGSFWVFTPTFLRGDRTPGHLVQARNFSNCTVGRGRRWNRTVCVGSVAPPGGGLWNDTLARFGFPPERMWVVRKKS